jgi:hypothetical protein
MQDRAGGSGAIERIMRDKMERPRSAALVAALSGVVVVGAACHLDALLHPPPTVEHRVGLDSLQQVESDSVTPIPPGGSAPNLVVRAVVRDTVASARRVEVEIQPAGTAFTNQATARGDPTPNGQTAYVPITGLTDNTSYHWQARLEGDTVWQRYGGTAANTVDVRIVLPVAATRLVFAQQPASAVAGATMATVKVAMVDAQGNTLTSFSGNVHVDIAPYANPAGGALGGSQDISATAGVATFSDLRITTAASGYRLEATADGVAPVVSWSFGINPGPGHHPRFLVQPSNTAPNRAIAPPVQVAILDVYNNVATSYSYVVYCLMGNDGSPGKNAQLDPSGDGRAPSAGIATFEDLKIDQAGVGYTLSCSGTGVHDEISAPFNVTP